MKKFFVLLLISYFAFQHFSERDFTTLSPSAVALDFPAVKNNNNSDQITLDDKSRIQELRKFISEASDQVKAEIKEYRHKISKLKLEAQKHYDGLSEDTKKFLEEEQDLKHNLSDAAKKHFLDSGEPK